MNPKPLFVNVFWPAAAGSVFWSFCTLLVDRLPAEFDPRFLLAIPMLKFTVDWTVVAHALTLILLAMYLAGDWLRVRVAREDSGFTYWLFNFIHLWTIIFAALVVQLRPAFVELFLAIVFVWAAIGHYFKIFASSESDDGKRETEIACSNKFAGINLLGCVVLVMSIPFGSVIWFAPASVAVVLFFWTVVAGRWRELVAVSKQTDC